ncbi:MAG TPA: ester cyclase [Blastocatellia bacterium]|nr:ester cyclase [Blastocatellia bacterium]
MSTTEENKTIARRYVDVWNQHDPAALDTVFAANAVRHDPATGVATGIESIRTIMQALLTAFPDLLITIDQALADEDCAILRWTATGTHNGDFQGIPPTGKPINVKGNSVYQCANGKMLAEHSIWDTLGLLKQLGAIPA